MLNAESRVTEIDGFITLAIKRNCYTQGRGNSYRSALNLALAQVDAPVDVYSSSTTVKQFSDEAAELLDRHQQETQAKPSSVSVYKSRLRNLLTDFERYHGTNLNAWRQELEGKAGPIAKRRRHQIVATASEPSTSRPTPLTTEHELLLGHDRRAWLRVPDPLTRRDIEHLWKQLEPLKQLLEFRVGALEDPISSESGD